MSTRILTWLVIGLIAAFVLAIYLSYNVSMG